MISCDVCSKSAVTHGEDAITVRESFVGENFPYLAKSIAEKSESGDSIGEYEWHEAMKLNHFDVCHQCSMKINLKAYEELQRLQKENS